MFYESLIILNISTLNFSEGVPASVVSGVYPYVELLQIFKRCFFSNFSLVCTTVVRTLVCIRNIDSVSTKTKTKNKKRRNFASVGPGTSVF